MTINKTNKECQTCGEERVIRAGNFDGNTPFCGDCGQPQQPEKEECDCPYIKDKPHKQGINCL